MFIGVKGYKGHTTYTIDKMAQETMRINTGLETLKLLKSQIEKELENRSDPLILCKTNTKNNRVIPEEHRKKAQSHYDSLMAKINRFQRLKKAIAVANATNKVVVGGNEMLVAEALELKNFSLTYKKKYLIQLKCWRNTAIQESDAAHSALETLVNANMKSFLESNKDAKFDQSAMESIATSIKKGNPITLLDPLKIDKIIEDLELEISVFESDCSRILTESNVENYITF